MTEEPGADPETAVTAPHQQLGNRIESNVPRIRYILLLGVTGLGRIVTWDGTSDLLPFGVTVGLLIAALAFFVVRARH
jgi:hypothetical protein